MVVLVESKKGNVNHRPTPCTVGPFFFFFSSSIDRSDKEEEDEAEIEKEDRESTSTARFLRFFLSSCPPFRLSSLSSLVGMTST